jgi:hypothetical protein
MSDELNVHCCIRYFSPSQQFFLCFFLISFFLFLLHWIFSQCIVNYLYELREILSSIQSNFMSFRQCSMKFNDFICEKRQLWLFPYFEWTIESSKTSKFLFAREWIGSYLNLAKVLWNTHATSQHTQRMSLIKTFYLIMFWSW